VHFLRDTRLQFHPIIHDNSCLCASQPVVKYHSNATRAACHFSMLAQAS
jgi:hypothetical protein